tara:strand:+ start:192 stop:1130 length:939 start_codon:yes stop_codon:yes gene_type:complete
MDNYPHASNWSAENWEQLHKHEEGWRPSFKYNGKTYPSFGGSDCNLLWNGDQSTYYFLAKKILGIAEEDNLTNFRLVRYGTILEPEIRTQLKNRNIDSKVEAGKCIIHSEIHPKLKERIRHSNVDGFIDGFPIEIKTSFASIKTTSELIEQYMPQIQNHMSVTYQEKCKVIIERGRECFEDWIYWDSDLNAELSDKINWLYTEAILNKEFQSLAYDNSYEIPPYDQRKVIDLNDLSNEEMPNWSNDFIEQSRIIAFNEKIKKDYDKAKKRIKLPIPKDVREVRYNCKEFEVVLKQHKNFRKDIKTFDKRTEE